jgi:hypothetical protein
VSQAEGQKGAQAPGFETYPQNKIRRLAKVQHDILFVDGESLRLAMSGLAGITSHWIRGVAIFQDLSADGWDVSESA